MSPKPKKYVEPQPSGLFLRRFSLVCRSYFWGPGIVSLCTVTRVRQRFVRHRYYPKRGLLGSSCRGFGIPKPYTDCWEKVVSFREHIPSGLNHHEGICRAAFYWS